MDMTEIQYRHKNTSVSLINYHFVLVSYEGRKLLIGNLKTRVQELIVQKAKDLDCAVINLAIAPAYIHLFLNSHPDLSPKTIMRQIKGYTSFALRKQFSHLQAFPSLWTRSYFVSTDGAETARQEYLEAQFPSCCQEAIILRKS